MSRPIRVIDKRNKHYFMVDDVYLNGYARQLGPITSMVYIALCRHVDKEQNAFPSQDQIAKEIKTGVRSVKNAIAELKEWSIIDVERERTEHKWARNSYYLLDKVVWRKALGAPGARDRSGAPDDIDQGHQVHTKDTHTKDTHNTLSIARVGEDDFKEIANKYQVPLSFVRSKYDDMVLWAGERPGNAKLRGRNWKLTLMKWVKTDSFKIKNQPRRGGMIHVES